MARRGLPRIRCRVRARARVRALGLGVGGRVGVGVEKLVRYWLSSLSLSLTPTLTLNPKPVSLTLTLTLTRYRLSSLGRIHELRGALLRLGGREECVGLARVVVVVVVRVVSARPVAPAPRAADACTCRRGAAREVEVDDALDAGRRGLGWGYGRLGLRLG